MKRGQFQFVKQTTCHAAMQTERDERSPRGHLPHDRKAEESSALFLCKREMHQQTSPTQGETSAAFPGDTHPGSPRWSTPQRETHEGGYPEPGKPRLESTQWTRKGSEPCSWVDRRAQICPGSNQIFDRWHHEEPRVIVQVHDWVQLFEHQRWNPRETAPMIQSNAGHNWTSETVRLWEPHSECQGGRKGLVSQQ